MSPEYHANEARMKAAHRLLWRIEGDRRANGTDDLERETAYAAAQGLVAGYHFRDAELYYAEKGIAVRG
jgi:hypothetical protein